MSPRTVPWTRFRSLLILGSRFTEALEAFLIGVPIGIHFKKLTQNIWQFPSPFPSPHRDCVIINERLFPFPIWKRRSGEEALERQPLLVRLHDSKSMKWFTFPRRSVIHNFKWPHSKAEEPYRLFHLKLPSTIITTQSLEGEGEGTKILCIS